MKTTTLIAQWLCLALAGCTTIGGSKYDDVRENADMEALRGDIARLKERVEAVESALQYQGNQSKTAPASEREQRETRERIEALDKAFRAAESSHAAMEERIIDDLSKRVATLMARNAGSIGGTSTGRLAGHPVVRNGGLEHVVKARETLTSIAAMYKVSVRALKEVNGMQDSDTIRVNQKLVIPEQAGEVSPGPSGRTGAR